MSDADTAVTHLDAGRGDPRGTGGSGRTRLAALARRVGGRWTGEATALCLVVAALTIIGLVMSLSASFVDAAQSGDPFATFQRQLLWAGVGTVVFTVAALVDHRRWRRLSWLLILGSLVALVLVLTPVGVRQFGSRRWLALGPFVVQPSEIAKLATLLWLADVLHRKRPADGGGFDLPHLLVPALPLLAVESVLVLLQPDLGTTVLLVGIVGLVLLAEGLPLRHAAAGAGVGALGATLLAFTADYRIDRITGWLHPEQVPEDSGFQLLQSLYALGSGGWFGVGLGSSRGKWNFIPNPDTDFIFAIIGEELGLVGALVVLGLFGALLVVGMRVARRAADGFGSTVALAITGWLVGQALLNVATVTGLLPITGVTLPLVSVGGSSLVTTLLALGILTSIARTTEADTT